MKKYFLSFSSAYFLFTPQPAQAALLSGLTGKDDISDLNSIYKLIDNAIEIIFQNALIIAVIMVCLGGIMYIVSAGDEKKTTQAKQILTYAISGFIILLLARVIIYVFATILSGGNPA